MLGELKGANIARMIVDEVNDNNSWANKPMSCAAHDVLG